MSAWSLTSPHAALRALARTQGEASAIAKGVAPEAKMQLDPSFPPAVVSVPPPEMLQALLSQALALVDSERPGARAWINQAIQFVSHPTGSGERPARGRNPRLAPWQANRVAAYVGDHLEVCIRVEDLAALARLTPGYFSKAFRGSFGLSPHAYLVERRIARACELMIRTDESLAQIALACGLYDQAHFTRVFRKRHGEAPGAWRRHRQEAPSLLAA